MSDGGRIVGAARQAKRGGVEHAPEPNAAAARRAAG